MNSIITIVHTVRNMSGMEGGVPESVYKLLKALIKESSGFRFKLLTGFSNDSIVENEQGLEVIRFDQLGDLKNKISTSNPVLIHDHGLWNPFNHVVAKWSDKRNIPRVVTPHGLLEPWAMNYKSWKKKLAWQLYQKKDLKCADYIHATAEIEAENLSKWNKGDNIQSIPWGIEIPEINDKKQKNEKNRILFLSRIQEKKGLRNLVNAWSKIRDVKWEIIIAGPDEGGHQGDIEELISQKGLNDFFHFTGEVKGKEKWNLYQSADIFVLPTFSENFGLVIGEALASGVPVITTKGAPWEDLNQYNCGLWIDIGVESLYEGLLSLMKLSDEERINMGLKGRELIKNKYSWDQCASQMIELYNKVLHKVQ